MIKISCLLVMLGLYSASALACSVAVSQNFQPTLKSWKRHSVITQEGEISDYWEKIPKPVIEVKEIRRGYAKQKQSCNGDICEFTYDSCSDVGMLWIQALLPKTSTYQIKDFGIYFRLKSDEQPGRIFPEFPIYGRVDDGKMDLIFAWLEQPKSQQKPLNLTVEAFFVANDLSIGPSMTFKIEQK